MKERGKMKDQEGVTRLPGNEDSSKNNQVLRKRRALQMTLHKVMCEKLQERVDSCEDITRRSEIVKIQCQGHDK